MSRNVAASILTALSQAPVAPFYAVEALFDGGAVRLWTGYGERTIDGEIYTGAGTMMRISGLEEVADLAAKSATITLSGISSSILSLALQEPYQGRTCRILFGVVGKPDAAAIAYTIGGVAPTLVLDLGAGVFGIRSLDASDFAVDGVEPSLVLDMGTGFYGTGPLENAAELEFVEVFGGRINTMSIEDAGETSTILLMVDSKLVELERARTRRYTHESQQSRYPGDDFFSFVSDLQDKDIVWGRAKA